MTLQLYEVAQRSDAMVALETNLKALNAHHDWFSDPARCESDNAGPHVIVVDDFYPDPHRVRERALQMQYEMYAPPSAAQVGEELAERFKSRPGTWRSTALVAFLGQPVRRPFYGERYNPPGVRDRLAGIVCEQIDERTWDTAGDYWNGAFHLMDGARLASGIHHHYKDGDVAPRGWSGVVYLSPDAPATAGTTIWREKSTGLCVAKFGAKFDGEYSKFDLAFAVENRFNRLVLFRENVLHRAEHGFGNDTDARLTQTFFFLTESAPSNKSMRSHFPNQRL